MAEPYSDEELAAWLAVYPPVISNTDARWRPTIERLLVERDEARGDAYALAAYATHCDEPQAENETRAMLTALAYPEVPHD